VTAASFAEEKIAFTTWCYDEYKKYHNYAPRRSPSRTGV
jgi:hypothetical protein